MIDESVLAYEKEMNELLTPLGVNSVVVERDSCYYMVVDGGKVFKTADEWEKKVGRKFVDFICVFVPKMFLEMERAILNETQVEFRIGTIFDMMLRIKEYGED